ncbi:MAG: carbohydrate kinase family protein [Fibrobacterota bacterium]|nr:carbohydrate kinase family protein [Fibrobacterota bacterium]
MPSHAFRIHGAGCGLADFIHADIDFDSPRLKPYRSLVPGDGGLEMGKVIFQEGLLEFVALRRAEGAQVGDSWEKILADIAGPDAPAPVFNAGGPAAAALAAASQLLRSSRTLVTYYGISGDDGHAARIRHTLAQTPLDLTCYRRRPGRTSSSHVFSDPRADGGGGDRFFIHRQGDDFPIEDAFIGESFFQAAINLYAGTAEVPALHKALPDLLQKSRRRGAITVVGTVFDFAAEKNAPGEPWPMGEGESFPSIDLLVVDAGEIRGLAGAGSAGAERSIEDAVNVLLKRGLTSVVVTCGAEPVYYRSIGGIFGECWGYAPVHAGLAERIGDRQINPGDTSGAGDNFLAGLLSDMIQQLLADDFYPKGETHIDRALLEISPLHLRRAVDFAVIVGGLACLQYGGVAIEKHIGEKLAAVKALLPQPIPAGRPW